MAGKTKACKSRDNMQQENLRNVIIWMKGYEPDVLQTAGKIEYFKS